MLAQPNYVGADYDVIANSMTGFFEFEKGDRRDIPDFNVFFRYNATYPFYSDAIWYLTQLRRWGQIPEDKANEADFPWDSDGFNEPTPAADTIDGIPYDGRAPNAYLESLPIGLKAGQTVVGNEVQG